ncbi:MAG: FkbM family methyltransferase [Myxococcaceae bacterium]|nr:FkbM family methyltransferase [Myxococcaceae bacterium]
MSATPSGPPPGAAPLWMKAAARIVRRLPLARYRAMNALATLAPVRGPFVARLPASHQGLRFECDLRNGLAREVFFTGQYEPQETCLVRALLRPGDTFVDVGAHWGYFTLLAAEAVTRAGRVVAVEADPRIHRTLVANLALNPLPHVTALHVAAAAEEGTVKLEGYDEAQDNWGISRVRDAARASSRAFTVPARPVDAMLDELGVGRVSLVKMDIEGAEVFALAGMRRGFQAHRYERLLLELHPPQLREHGREPAELTRMLTEAGYQGWAVDHSPEATRRWAYARVLEPRQLLRPLSPSAPLDEWPHVLWVAPGVPSPI